MSCSCPNCGCLRESAPALSKDTKPRRPKLTAEEKAQRQREASARYYRNHKAEQREARNAYMSKYYATNREAILERLRLKRRAAKDAARAAEEAAKEAEDASDALLSQD